MNGRTYALDPHGNDVIVGGTFTSIREAASTSPLQNQSFLFKFNVVTGDIDPASDPFLNGEVDGVAISADAAGTVDPTPPWVKFSVSTAAPDTTPANANVESPVPFVVGSPLLAEETASDDTGVIQVRVAVRDVGANLWLQSDGVTWAASYAAFQAVPAVPGATETDWTFQVALTPGSYALDVRARDPAGNLDPTPPWVKFTVADL